MQIWRIHLKSDSIASVNPKQFCFDNNIVGVGWRAPEKGPFLNLEAYRASAQTWYAGSQSWQMAINTISNLIQPLDLIWTRDDQGSYYLGQIDKDGGWVYQDSQKNVDADMLNVRPCTWYKIGTADTVPGKVASSFFSRRTIQRIHDEPVKLFSEFLLQQLAASGPKRELRDISYTSAIFSLLSPDDCEDLVGLYLQLRKGFLLVPSSCKSSTATYEYSLVHKDTGRAAVVQVKLGSVNLDFDDFSTINEDVYLCTTSGTYSGQPRDTIHVIEPAELVQFLSEAASIMPSKIKNRLLLYQQMYGSE